MDKLNPHFSEVIHLIQKARYQALKAVDTELINLYWEIGKYISERTTQKGWGKSIIVQLANYIQTQEPGTKGFSDKNHWRMKQFYDTYAHSPKLAPLVREYQDKKLLQAKLHELIELWENQKREEI